MVYNANDSGHDSVVMDHRQRSSDEYRTAPSTVHLSSFYYLSLLSMGADIYFTVPGKVEDKVYLPGTFYSLHPIANVKVLASLL